MDHMKTVTDDPAPSHVNELWEKLFMEIYRAHGCRSIRTFEVAAFAEPLGFPVTAPRTTEELHQANETGMAAQLAKFGMLLRRKHTHVHGNFRFIADRVAEEWSQRIPRSTYHVEPIDGLCPTRRQRNKGGAGDERSYLNQWTGKSETDDYDPNLARITKIPRQDSRHGKTPSQGFSPNSLVTRKYEVRGLDSLDELEEE